MESGEKMDGSQFHLVEQEVYAMKSPYVAVIGTVEGGSISIDDFVDFVLMTAWEYKIPLEVQHNKIKGNLQQMKITTVITEPDAKMQRR